ncbi:FRIGIDA-like protein 4a [Dorcoceras hygrometricum]|uniref:FRIGIDA-like protein n=1 Tax=Dorcoceras hygrometricum TaxID=472368 RepID=A0A2Z7A4M0_9LAMI|nr:FRIGIDA-like protein 4a [Dorcoceras hygrometricum]
MGSQPDPGGLNQPQPSFDEFQRQTSLMTSCTLLWKELSDHFSSLEQDIMKKSEALKAKFQALTNETQISMRVLDNRESSISKSMSMAYESLERATNLSVSAAMSKDPSTDKESESTEEPEVDNSVGVLMKLSNFCRKMASKECWSFVTARKKELEVFRSEMPKALADCVDPPKFVLEAISEVFPVDRREASSSYDLGWACVMLLESLIPLMMDPVLGKERMLVTPSIRGKAENIAETWKKSLEERGGIENTKTPDVHTFLQHLVTFGIVKEEDLGLYRKLVVASAWRKQMPKLAVSLGLADKMPDMIEELIGRGQQVDAVHFSYEVGLTRRFPPVPLLKAFLKDAKKAATSLLEDASNSGRAVIVLRLVPPLISLIIQLAIAFFPFSVYIIEHLAAKKEQSSIRAVLKCIEEYKLEAEFPPESLKKRLEQLDKTKIEKKKPASPTAKRTRGSTGGPMPPAKAGRSTNAYVSSFPSPPTYIRSPSHSQYPSPVPAYPATFTMYPHGNRSPQYTYSPENAPPPTIIGSYPVSPVNYQAYGGYSNAMAPAYQQAYY